MKKKLAEKFLLTIFLITIVFLLFSFSVFSQGYLRTKGKEIVNDNGIIQLKGLNLGNWLVNEGYLMETLPAADSHSEIKALFEHTIGKAVTDSFYTVFRANYIQKKDIDRITAMGFNHVRLPFHYNLLTPEDSDGVYLEKGFAYLDSVVSWCKSNNIYVILDMHCLPGGANAAGHGDPPFGVAELWNDTLFQKRTVAVWAKIADRYKNEAFVGGYDLINEPVTSSGETLRKVYIQITDEIRKIDTNHIVFIEGNNYASSFKEILPPWDKNMVYSFHKYWTPNNFSNIQNVLSIRNTYNIPIWLGEAGENSNTWYGDLIKLLEDNGIGWCWWLYKKPNSITAPYKVVFNQGWKQLSDYWKGGAKPSQVEINKAFFDLANNTLLDECNFNVDVMESMMRRDYKTVSTPWPSLSNNKIPGRLFAAEFDNGRQGVAYSDKVFQSVAQGSGYTAWNDNWIGRNDGVEMEYKKDTIGVYTIGNIEDGEWILFTVNVDTSGLYNVSFRVASAASTGAISLHLDGNPLTSILNIGSTQGWYNWKTITVSNVALEKGEHRLKVLFNKGSFNINYIDFDWVSVGTGIGDNTVKAFTLKQNSPNPASQHTSIEYTLNRSAVVSLSLFDILGNQVMKVVAEKQELGDYKREIDVSLLSAGIYYYRLTIGGNMETRKLQIIR